MKGRTGSLETAVLKTRWRRWLKIVELFASERPARRRVDPEAYGMLQKELVTTCRSLAAAANEVDGAFYRYLEDLVQPWLSPLVLWRADREILCDLLVRCRQVERALAGPFLVSAFASLGSPDSFRVVFCLPLGVGPGNHR